MKTIKALSKLIRGLVNGTCCLYKEDSGGGVAYYWLEFNEPKGDSND